MADQEVRRGQVVVEDVEGGLEGGVQGQVGYLGGEGGRGGFGGGCEGGWESEEVRVEGGEGGVGGGGVGGGHGEKVGWKSEVTVNGKRNEGDGIDTNGIRWSMIYRRRHYFSHWKNLF